MAGMQYQCPWCDSFDVRKNKKGEVVCFECFSVCSIKDDVDIRLNSRTQDLPPPFPEELERPKNKRKGLERRNSSAHSGIITNTI